MNGDDGKLLRYLAATVEEIRDRMATKDDLAALESRMATKDDLAALESRMATKDGLTALESRMATFESRMATKEDVVAIRGDIEQVQLRIDGVDRTLSTRMDAMDNRISRLRSAVYILAKDEPAVKRLLGD
jgi:uncharacterized coiled-coil protein SlyX